MKKGRITSQNRFRKLIVVTGTPGTGKTMFSMRLAKRIDAEYVSFSRLMERRKLYSKVDRSRNSKIVNITKARSYLSKLTSGTERTIIVDSHISGVCPQQFTKKVLVLRCEPKILEKRLRDRGWNEKKIRENVLAEILDVCLSEAIDEYGVRRVEQLITSHSDVDSCVRSANRILSRQKTKKVLVDWFSKAALDTSSKYVGA